MILQCKDAGLIYIYINYSSTGRFMYFQPLEELNSLFGNIYLQSDSSLENKLSPWLHVMSSL